MSRPVRLAKIETNDSIFYNLCEKLEAFILSHASFFLIISVIVLMALFIALCYALVGVSATESGAVYNNMSRWV